MAIRDDFSFQTKINLLQTVKDLIKNPMEFTPGQCPSGMCVALNNKEDDSLDDKTALMRCHLLAEHDGDHEHNGFNESIWFWKDN